MRKIIIATLIVFGVVATALLAIVLVMGFWTSLQTKHLDSSETAGWVQAIGSVLGLGVAVGIMYVQHQQAERREAKQKLEREDRMLRSIRIEVDVLLTSFKRTMKIENVPDSRPVLERYFFFSEKPFVVYESLAGNLLDIRDDKKRRLIIETYSKAQGVIVLVQMNNDILAERDEYFRNMGERGQDKTNSFAHKLRYNADQFWERYEEAVLLVDSINRSFPE